MGGGMATLDWHFSQQAGRAALHVNRQQPLRTLPQQSRKVKRASTRHRANRRELLLGSFAPCCCGLCKPKDGWYDKFFAYAMANGMQAYEEAVTPFKYRLLDKARNWDGPQNILEVGIGAAPNLHYLTSQTGRQLEGMKVTGIDPNPHMFPFARESAQKAGLANDAFDLKLGVAEDLPVEDASFDTVICTLVLCSVPDVPAAVKEMRRVLRPGGRVLWLEHVIAAPERRLLRLGQQVLNPVQQLLADGCHLNRNPMPAFEAAGFSSLEVQTFDVPGMGAIAPHISGIARA